MMRNVTCPSVYCQAGVLIGNMALPIRGVLDLNLYVSVFCSKSWHYSNIYGLLHALALFPCPVFFF